MQNLSPNPLANQPWQRSLQSAFRDLAELCSFLELEQPTISQTELATGNFPLMVTREFAARMEKGNPADPLLLQVIPLAKEWIETPGYSVDPLAELVQNPLPGLLHKYHGRVLITLTGRCAINCRYCFRRHFPYQDNNPGRAGHARLLQYIADNPSIHEVILSGGDPLISNDKTLQQFITALSEISTVNTLRIHSRIPIVLPSRINNTLLDMLTQTRLHCVMVYHANHPNEIDEDVTLQAKRLQAAGVTLLNQSVLLAGINDNAQTLTQLSHRLFQSGILPYYLHCCDKTQGTAHFDVNLTQAEIIMTSLRGLLPGYLVPRLVREIPGENSKIDQF